MIKIMGIKRPPLNKQLPKLLPLVVAQALINMSAEAASIEVTSNLDDGTDCTLREALATINAGFDQANGCVIDSSMDALGTNNTIIFGAGVSGTTITLGGSPLEINADVSINPGGTTTTISGNHSSAVLNINVNLPTTDVKLDALTITEGANSGINISRSVPFIDSLNLEITNSTISGNTATQGGGIYFPYIADSSSLTLNNSTVSDNSSIDDGGGVYFNAGYSDIMLTNSTISGNSSGGFGGGILVGFGGDIILNHSTISGNTASRSGGGISGTGGPFGDSITMNASTVSGNNAGGNGGGISQLDRVRMNNSTVSGNNSGGDGGGIHANPGPFGAGGSVSLVNSTVSGNTARRGGGLYVQHDVRVGLSNSTLSGNSASVMGGGIFLTDNLAGTYYDNSLILRNSIVANSIAGDCVSRESAVSAASDSIIQDGSCSAAAMAVDPLLGPLADNGGPTQTHALLAGSPAIDNASGTGATTSDQRGELAVGIRDSGAYEFTGAANALTIEKRINNVARETLAESAQLLTGSLFQQSYTVTNTSPDHLYRVRVFENGNQVCNFYTLAAGETKTRCKTIQTVLSGDQHVQVDVNAKISGTSDTVSATTDSYYTGIDNAQGAMEVTHFINNHNADTPDQAQTLASPEAQVLFKIENTGEIELYRVKTYHDPVSPVNGGWQELCNIGPLMPGQVRYCKQDITITESGLNYAIGRAQGRNSISSATSVINASNPTYFIVP